MENESGTWVMHGVFEDDPNCIHRKDKKGEGYGWTIAVYSTPEHLWGYDHVTSAYKEDPADSWERIAKRMKDICPTATEAQIRRVTGISKAGSKSPRRESARTEAKDWIIPANPKYYDVVGAFGASGIVTWKQGSDIHVGDMIYMYVATPHSSILYKCSAGTEKYAKRTKKGDGKIRLALFQCMLTRAIRKI